MRTFFLFNTNCNRGGVELCWGQQEIGHAWTFLLAATYWLCLRHCFTYWRWNPISFACVLFKIRNRNWWWRLLLAAECFTPWMTHIGRVQSITTIGDNSTESGGIKRVDSCWTHSLSLSFSFTSCCLHQSSHRIRSLLHLTSFIT